MAGNRSGSLRRGMSAVLLGMLIAASACLAGLAAESTAPQLIGATKVAVAGYFTIASEELVSAMAAGAHPQLVDVREPSEYANDGHIPGAILIPLGTLADRLKELNPDEEIVVICRSGSRSLRGAAILVSAGFGRVLSLTRGMMGWTGAVEMGPVAAK